MNRRRKAVIHRSSVDKPHSDTRSVTFISNFVLIFIDREAREIMHLVASVRPSVHLSVRPFVCALTAEPLGVITSLRCLSVCL